MTGFCKNIEVSACSFSTFCVTIDEVFIFGTSFCRADEGLHNKDEPESDCCIIIIISKYVTNIKLTALFVIAVKLTAIQPSLSTQRNFVYHFHFFL